MAFGPMEIGADRCDNNLSYSVQPRSRNLPVVSKANRGVKKGQKEIERELTDVENPSKRPLLKIDRPK